MTQTQPAPMDGLAQLRAMVAGVLPTAPIATTLGMSAFDVPERGRVRVELVPDLTRHGNPLGTVHGGVHSTLLDTVCGCAVHSTLAPGERYTSLDLTVKFLRPATDASGVLRAEGTMVQRGRRTALAEGRLTDADGRLVAFATSTCMIFPADDGAAG
ncbi:PaaI family thioesterase [Nocardioides sp. ChNu-99]|uniref:PaaI family thioesterase n=1 Tax=Nocardioides sp. ChNu-99 TaxID=2839897 RepID=UPI002406C405|nr:PaaI family thioesterase [Nocardioides sp. ChNu-99]MDF9714712.1 PaaI family thioesterase [Nocardioides sp. ChNu-99]